MINKKPCPENVKLRIPKPIEAKIIPLGKLYHFGPERIAHYIKRHQDIDISGI